MIWWTDTCDGKTLLWIRKQSMVFHLPIYNENFWSNVVATVPFNLPEYFGTVWKGNRYFVVLYASNALKDASLLQIDYLLLNLADKIFEQQFNNTVSVRHHLELLWNNKRMSSFFLCTSPYLWYSESEGDKGMVCPDVWYSYYTTHTILWPTDEIWENMIFSKAIKWSDEWKHHNF